jgi:hypothetical protein
MLLHGGPIPQDQKRELLRQQAEANPAQVLAGETAVPHTVQIDVDSVEGKAESVPVQHESAPEAPVEK